MEDNLNLKKMGDNLKKRKKGRRPKKKKKKEDDLKKKLRSHIRSIRTIGQHLKFSKK